MNEKEHLEWLEERELKLEKLERMINYLQLIVNDDSRVIEKEDIQMEIYKLYYFNTRNKEYGDE